MLKSKYVGVFIDSFRAPHPTRYFSPHKIKCLVLNENLLLVLSF